MNEYEYVNIFNFWNVQTIYIPRILISSFIPGVRDEFQNWLRVPQRVIQHNNNNCVFGIPLIKGKNFSSQASCALN